MLDRISFGIYQDTLQANLKEMKRFGPGAAAFTEFSRIMADIKRRLEGKRRVTEATARVA